MSKVVHLAQKKLDSLKNVIVVTAPAGSTITCNGKRYNKNRILNPAWRNLPADYTQVEYIESTGTQYINTGSAGSQTDTIKMTCSVTRESGNHYLFGTVYSTYFNYGVDFTGLTSTITCHYGGDSSFTFDVPRDNKYNIIYSFSNTQINDVTAGTKFNVTQTTSYPFFLFGAGNNSSALVYPTKMRIYSYIKESVLYSKLADYVPCYKIATDEYGFFDTVSMTFKGNGGTGTFLHGDVVSQYCLAENWEIPVSAFGTYTITTQLGQKLETRQVIVDHTGVYSVDIDFADIIDDYFIGTTLDTDTWTAQTSGGTIVVNDGLTISSASSKSATLYTNKTFDGSEKKLTYELAISNEGGAYASEVSPCFGYSTSNSIQICSYIRSTYSTNNCTYWNYITSTSSTSRVTKALGNTHRIIKVIVDFENNMLQMYSDDVLIFDVDLPADIISIFIDSPIFYINVAHWSSASMSISHFKAKIEY